MGCRIWVKACECPPDVPTLGCGTILRSLCSDVER